MRIVWHPLAQCLVYLHQMVYNSHVWIRHKSVLPIEILSESHNYPCQKQNLRVKQPKLGGHNTEAAFMNSNHFCSKTKQNHTTNTPSLLSSHLQADSQLQNGPARISDSHSSMVIFASIR